MESFIKVEHGYSNRYLATVHRSAILGRESCLKIANREETSAKMKEIIQPTNQPTMREREVEPKTPVDWNCLLPGKKPTFITVV